MRRIHLDHAATTPVDARVLDAMLRAYALPGNPSAAYASGREARQALENAREEIAALLQVRPGEVFFTSGGTESDNWALRGMATSADAGQLVISAIEHHAILETAEALHRRGVPLCVLPVSSGGTVDIAALEAALTQKTALVSVMTANNETGVVQPIHVISALCRGHGVPFHTDAVQAVGSVPASALCADADLVSLSAHKFHGPKGIGVLVVRKGTRLQRLLYGGAQERYLRAGTENVPGAVGFAAALSQAEARRLSDQAHFDVLRDRLEEELFAAIPGLERDAARRLAGYSILVAFKGARLQRMLYGGAQERGLRAGTENIPGAVGFAAALAQAEAQRLTDQAHIAALRDRLEEKLFAAIPGLERNGDAAQRLAGHSNLCFPVRDGRALLMRLDMAGVECSAGSACASGSPDPSHVLIAMGRSREEALRSLRFTLGRDNTEDEIDEAAAIIAQTVTALRSA